MMQAIGLSIMCLLIVSSADSETSFLQLTQRTRTSRFDYQHPSWLESCSSIYLDVGSNKGVQIRKLFEPSLYPGAPALALFDESYGPPEKRCRPAAESGICALGFEPNPQHYDRLRKLEAAYTKQGWHVHFYFVAAATNTSVTSFTGMGSEGGDEVDLGAHLNLGLGLWQSVLVQAVDFADFLGSLPAGKVKLMKMDIEGEEFNVLAHMAERGMLCGNVIKEAFVEVHNITSVATWANTDYWEGKPTAEALSHFVQSRSCENGTMQLVQMDDESFLEDVNDDFGKANACAA